MHAKNPEEVTKWQTFHFKHELVLSKPLKEVVSVVLITLLTIVYEEDHLGVGALLMLFNQVLKLLLLTERTRISLHSLISLNHFIYCKIRSRHLRLHYNFIFVVRHDSLLKLRAEQYRRLFQRLRCLLV